MTNHALGIPKQHKGKSCKKLRKGCFKSLEVKEEIKGASLVIAGIKYPTTDGKKNQRLKTDGNGKLSWISPPVTTELPISSIKFTGQYHGIAEILTLGDDEKPKYIKSNEKHSMTCKQLKENSAFFTLKSTTIPRWSFVGILFKEGPLIKGKSITTNDSNAIDELYNFKIGQNGIVSGFNSILRIPTTTEVSLIKQITYTRVPAPK